MGHADGDGVPVEAADLRDSAGGAPLHERRVHHEYRTAAKVSGGGIRKRNARQDRGRVRRQLQECSRSFERSERELRTPLKASGQGSRATCRSLVVFERGNEWALASGICCRSKARSDAELDSFALAEQRVQPPSAGAIDRKQSNHERRVYPERTSCRTAHIPL